MHGFMHVKGKCKKLGAIKTVMTSWRIAAQQLLNLNKQTEKGEVASIHCPKKIAEYGKTFILYKELFH
jgi:hypothetical protein